MPALIRVEFAENGRVVVSQDQPFVNDPDWDGPYGAAAELANQRGSGAAFPLTQATNRLTPQEDQP